MLLKKLEYLESIYRLRNFTKAADENYISQPSITNAVRSLEEELGVVLIERKLKPMRFTPAGEQFMRHVYTILNAVNNAMSDMKNLSKSDEIVLNMGFTSTARNWLVPKIYMEFQSLYPAVNVALQENTTSVMLAQLISEDLDLLFTLLPDDENLEMYESIPLQICELGVLLPADHEWAQYKRVPLEYLRQERLLTFPPGSLIRSRLQKEFQRLHITPRFQTVAQLSVATQMVRFGHGLTFTTRERDRIEDREDGLVFRPFLEKIQLLESILIKRGRPRTTAMQWMISFLKDSVGE